MKKFLTVLLVITVMFTFSFSSAFAYTDAQLQNVVDTHEKAVKAIQDKYDENLAALNRDYSAKLANPVGTTDKDAWKVACDAALDTAKANLNKELAQAWNTLATAEAAVTDPVGWVISGSTTDIPTPVDTGYVDVRPALAMLQTKALGNVSADEAVFDATMTKTLNLVKNYDLSKFVTDDNYNNSGKSSYQTAVEAQNDALLLLASYKYPTNTIQNIKDVYDITGVGTLGEKESGSFYRAIMNLKTTAVAKTDEAKIAYAKAAVTSDIKSMIETQRAADLKVQNDIIFAQSIATKPNQKAIDKANEEIANINEKYDNYLKVWTYRLENGTYKVEKAYGVDQVNVYYGNSKIAYIGYFDANGTFAKSDYTIAKDWTTLTAALPVADATKIVDHVADLEKEAADLKATIFVDGDVAADVDSALADAVKDTYMLGTLTNHVSTTLTNSVVHQRAHQLLGTTCSGATKTDKVTVNSKKYDNVSQWTTNGYSSENTKTVKAIIKDAKDAIMAAKTVADAEAAFVAAYDKYDAVLTIAEQNALFSYKGELYKKDTAVKAELNAYIDYKVALMDDAIPGVAVALKAYYNANLLTEVNNAADLDKAVADAKAFVDSLKTLKEIKAEDKALRDKIVALARPVTLEKKAEVVALYDEYLAFDKYCTKVGYSNTESEGVAALLGDDVKRVAGLEKDAMDEIVKAIEKDGKVTLDDRANVEALVKAMDAYNDLYPEYALNIAAYKTAKDYEELIFNLDVDAANKLIAALPAYGASAAQIKAAKDAVAALGFKGICKLDSTMVTKLNRLEASIGYDVEAIKIKASSKATKGAMTIKWRVVGGNKDAADGYQVWKSTKQSKGYKKAFTTTKQSYKNTKGLKKGTRYYYKVRAYKVVDGKNVYSDWSNKAYRVAK